jgi:hypothetical protein
MQRRLIGSKWASLHDRRFFSVYTLEKAGTNPHWHGLIQFYDAAGNELARQGRVFDEYAHDQWRALVLTGDAVVKTVFDNPGAIDYVAKSLATNVNYTHYVLPDAFWRP